MAEIETAKLNEIFLRLTKNIKERKIGLKDNVQKKNLLILNELNPGFLRDMQTKIKIQMENIKNLSIEIGKNTLWSKIEELNKEIEKKQQHLSNISREILNTEHEISKITTDDVDKKIIDILKSLNIELVEE